MKKTILSIALAMTTLSYGGQNNVHTEFAHGNIEVSIVQGSGWLHDFPLFWFIKKKNAPQIAIWIEDMEGNFLSTIYVSEKLAKQSWMLAGGNRRKESLPCWSYAHGRQYADGLYLPTKDEPLPDAITGATPKGSFTTHIQMKEDVKQFIVMCEFNHSVDFNAHYPKNARKGDANYSGGKLGSGQPAIIYRTVVDVRKGLNEFKGELVGHSSPDGSDGNVYSDISKLTTALDIVKGITVYIK